jgi:hypothetical protein
MSLFLTTLIYATLAVILAGEVIAMLVVAGLILRWVLTTEWELEK